MSEQPVAAPTGADTTMDLLIAASKGPQAPKPVMVGEPLILKTPARDRRPSAVSEPSGTDGEVDREVGKGVSQGVSLGKADAKKPSGPSGLRRLLTSFAGTKATEAPVVDKAVSTGNPAATPKAVPATKQESVSAKPVAAAPESAEPVKTPPPVKAPRPAKPPRPVKVPRAKKAPAPKLPAAPKPAPKTAPVSVPSKKPPLAPSGKDTRGRVHRWIPALVIVPVVAATAVLLSVNNGSTPPVIGAVGVSAPTSEAATWLVDYASPDQRVVVDDALRSDLVRAGWSPSDVVGSTQLSNWRDIDYVVASEAIRAASGDGDQLRQAIANSVVVASFGAGADLAEVRLITPQGALLATATQQQDAVDRAQFGSELASNAGVQVSDADRALLTGGRVDPRIIFVLATLASNGEVVVAAFPVIDGEQSGVIRQVAITSVGEQPLVASAQLTPAAQTIVDELNGAYAPSDAYADDGNLLLRYTPALNPFAE